MHILLAHHDSCKGQFVPLNTGHYKGTVTSILVCSFHCVDKVDEHGTYVLLISKGTKFLEFPS